MSAEPFLSPAPTLDPAPDLTFPPDVRLTIPEVIAARAAADPAEIALTVVRARGRQLVTAPLTFGEVDQGARRVAAALEAAGVGLGDRVVLAIEDPGTFLRFFLGALGLGAIPVPLPPSSGVRMPGALRERFLSVRADCAPRVVAVEDEAAWARSEDAEAGEVVVLDAAAALARADVPGTFDLARPPHAIAYLQYTSGSTGHPKGVCVTHHNLVANLQASIAASRMTPADRSFSWLPLYHDMGLIGGLLLGVYLGIPTFVMPTSDWVARPDAWMRAIATFGATYTVAPNFAYAVVAKKMPDAAIRGLDLSCLRLAYNGAEPIDPATLEGFARRYAPHGLRSTAPYPVYGLAENTLAVTFPDPEELPTYDWIDREALVREGRAVSTEADPSRALGVVSVGRPVPGVGLRIVDPESGRTLGERVVGEIRVRGASVTPGYYRVGGSLPQPPDELRTGDVGYLADGRLHVVDRLKDILIVGGSNYAPSDVERCAARVEGVRTGRVMAFSTPGPDGTSAVHLVAELDPASLRTGDAIASDVRARVLSDLGLALADVRLVLPGSLPRTTSGKLRRQAAREIYRSGELRPASGLGTRAGLAARRVRDTVAAWWSLRRG